MKIKITLFALLLSLISFGQDREFENVNTNYKNQNYTEAIAIGEKILQNQYGSVSPLLKLYTTFLVADSYKLLNRYPEALKRYSEYLEIIKVTTLYSKKNIEKATIEIQKIIDELQTKIVVNNKVSSSTKANQIESKTNNTESEVTSTTVTNNTETDKIVILTVSGSGKTIEEAKQVALRGAIEQAYGAFISSKTEILNDEIVADQMTSIASGNIQSYEILNESQLPNQSWGVTLKVIVSVEKLQSFMQAKGVTIEIKGGLFAINIKQQMLNEQGEINAVYNMVTLLHEAMQTSFDYEIKSSEPKSLDEENINWEIPFTVKATANKNIEFCNNYLIKTLRAVSLTNAEVENYKLLNKRVIPIVLQFKENEYQKGTFYLRKINSLNIINTFIKQINYYLFGFKIQQENNEYIIKEYSSFENKIKNSDLIIYDDDKSTNSYYKSLIPNPYNNTINLLPAGDTGAIITWKAIKSLEEIQSMTGYSIKPAGVISQIKNGGLVVYEKDGHGLVTTLFDYETQKGWGNLPINGYNDWRNPTKDELNEMYSKLANKGLGGFIFNKYLYSLAGNNITDGSQLFSGYCDERCQTGIRPVRVF